MTKKKSKQGDPKLKVISKAPTGIKGLDEITYGGLPKGRPSLICGNAGSGKSLFAAEFLYHGAKDYNERGLLVSFEETQNEIITNVASLGFDFNKLIAQKMLSINHVHVDRDEFDEIGAYNLDGLFIQLNHIVKTLNIKRIVIDTLEVLFGNFTDQAILRTEVQRLFRWVKQNNLTAIITAETGSNSISRYGLEEYVADCVILLDNRLEQQISTRRLRVIKYRGSNHRSNEYPFLIDKNGIIVLPISSLRLNSPASHQRVSTGIKRLDTMFGGKGYYRGSGILFSGVAGTGKSSFCAAFANSVCESGERCLYFSFEESINQILRNMKSIGIDLSTWVDKNSLLIHSEQPYANSLEGHLVVMHDLIEKFKPHAVIIDPISNLKEIGNALEVKALFARLIDYLKMKKITVLSTSLISDNVYEAQSKDNVSSLKDTWVLLQNLEDNGEQNRGIIILKSRGMKHSNQVREVILSDKGIDLLDVHIDAGHILSGTARIEQAAQKRAMELLRDAELLHNKQVKFNRLTNFEHQIMALQAELKNAKEDMKLATIQESLASKEKAQSISDISDIRMADVTSARKPTKNRRPK